MTGRENGTSPYYTKIYNSYEITILILISIQYYTILDITMLVFLYLLLFNYYHYYYSHLVLYEKYNSFVRIELLYIYIYYIGINTFILHQFYLFVLPTSILTKKKYETFLFYNNFYNNNTANKARRKF